MAESERRFEDIARKLATMETESERSTERCTLGITEPNRYTEYLFIRIMGILSIKSD